MQTLEPVVFARLMKLPAALRSDVLECFSATGMGPRQIEDLIESLRKDIEDDLDETRQEVEIQ